MLIEKRNEQKLQKKSGGGRSIASKKLNRIFKKYEQKQIQI